MVSIVVLASGSGSNFEVIAQKAQSRESQIQILALISDNPSCYALERARKLGIPTHVIDFSKFRDRLEFDQALKSLIDSLSPDLIVLAGYMKLLKLPEFFQDYSLRIINLHPALLPSFPGYHGIRDAYDYGSKVSGITIHFVDQGVDTGPIILQKSLEIPDSISLEALEEKIHSLEHEHFWRVIDSFNHGHYELRGKRAVFVPRK